MITLSAVMLSIPQIQFRHRITRALLPTANLARLSRVQVTVLAPTPPDLTVPHGEPVAVEVQLAGPKVSAVTIETVSSKDVRQRIEMRYEEGRRYSAVLQPGRESLEWRVKAGDAVTRYYHLTSRARPYAKLFENTYRYPAYTALPPSTVKEPTGDLRALEETVADIVIRPDQPVATAHLKIDWDGKQEEIALNVASDGGLTATLPIRCLIRFRGTRLPRNRIRRRTSAWSNRREMCSPLRMRSSKSRARPTMICRWRASSNGSR
jgi:hypothetical protein